MIPKIKSHDNVITILPLVKKATNLLPSLFFDKLKKLLTENNEFPYYLLNETVHAKVKEPASHFMFTHTLFHPINGKTSSWFDMFEPIISI